MHTLPLALSLLSASALTSPDFYFGVSNAAFQVEGNPGDSDWRRWTHATDAEGNPRIKDCTDAEVATRFWERYDEDFALAEGAGLNAFRISVAWERIEPSPGHFDDAALAHYAEMLVAMRQRGLEPFVTLQHFVLPGWVADQGGLLWEEYPSHFAHFAAHVAASLAKGPAHVRFFITLNEPNIQVFGGYLNDHKFPPGIQDADLATQALANLAQAHVEAFNAIRDRRLAGTLIGFSHNWQVYRPAGHSQADVDMASHLNQLYNGAFMTAVLSGELDFAMPGAQAVRRTLPLPHGPTLDFVGVQNYGRSLVSAEEAAPGFRLSDSDGPRNDMGWEIVPSALYDAVSEIAAYGKPVIITETGTADRGDALRQQYLRYNFAALQELREAGVALFGYIHWSLTDNFEWDSGKTPRFGLVEVDYATQRYAPRPSLQLYHDLIQTMQP